MLGRFSPGALSATTRAATARITKLAPTACSASLPVASTSSLPSLRTRLASTPRSWQHCGFSTSRQVRQAEPVDGDAFDINTVERVSDEVDVCIVGGGPAGLSAAIRLKQLANKEGRELRVVLLEKGGEVGASRGACQ